MNWIAILVAALVPMAVGFVWYHKKVMGDAWMRETGLTEEKINGANMPMIYGLSLLFAIMLAMATPILCIHQMGVESALLNAVQDPARADAAKMIVDKFKAGGEYANEFRTFKHGALHGILSGIFLIFPIIATNGFFERKSFKLTMMNTAYWTIVLAIMCGIVSGWQ